MAKMQRFGIAAMSVALAVVICCPNQILAQTLETICVFQGGEAGQWPTEIAQGPTGPIYGTSEAGGKENDGTLFEVTSKGEEIVLHSFNGEDGDTPYEITASKSGYLYGITVYGHTYGTVFRSKARRLTVLYNFTGPPDGAFPYGRLLADQKGILYGTTGQGGTGTCAGGCGTVFSIDSTGHEATLYNFTGPDGAYPTAGLIADRKGNFYGTTGGGGSNYSCSGGCGTVFELDARKRLKVLHNFNGGNDGNTPFAELYRDSAGNLFGTTLGGGPLNNGVIFEVTSSGRYRVLHKFKGIPDGAVGAGPLSSAPDGSLYGVTDNGGAECTEQSDGCGTIYRIDSSGKYSVVHRFNGVTDGAGPQGALVIDTKGRIYGVTTEGPWDGCEESHSGCGTIWKLSFSLR